MIIVPTFSQGKQADQPVIAAGILRPKGTFAERMADRVYTPGGMMRDKDADESTPDESAPTRDEERDCQSKQSPQEPGPVNKNDDGVAAQPATVYLGSRHMLEEPANMRVP